MELLLSPLHSNPSLAITSPARSRSLTLPSRTLLPTPGTWRPSVSPVLCRRSDYSQQQQPPRGWGSRPFPDFNSSAAFQTQPSEPAPDGQGPGKVFVDYTIYKGKAALCAGPKGPEFTKTESGAYRVTREGVVLLQLAPAIGARRYDWNRKQIFSLSVTEIGTLMGLGAKDSCEFFHDPFTGTSEEGKIRKVLKVEPLPDSTGHFFNLHVQNRISNVDENIYIPITRGELAVLNTAFNFVIPHLLGWNVYVNSIRPEDKSKSNNSDKFGVDAEWSR